MRKYLNTLLIISVVSIGSKTLNAQWRSEFCPVNENLHAIAVAGTDTYWIVGDRGTILYRNSAEWLVYPKTTAENLYSINFTGENNGWAVGANGTILHFDGLNWKPFTSPVKTDLLSVNFKDADNGIASGGSGTILIYHEGIWSEAGSEQRGSFYAAAYSSNDIWLGGGLECVNFPIMRIQGDNKDNLMMIRDSKTYATLKSMYFFSSDRGWAVGSPSTILYYDGSAWLKPVIDEKYPSLNSVCFEGENNGITVGYNGTILSYRNNSWIREESGTIHDLNGAVINGNTCYAVGDHGTIITENINIPGEYLSAAENSFSGKKLISDSLNNLTQGSSNSPFMFELLPNPCDESLNVRMISGYRFEQVQITLTNIYGQVLLQKNVDLEDSNVNYLIKTSSFESGFYMLKLTTGDKSTTRLVVIGH